MRGLLGCKFPTDTRFSLRQLQSLDTMERQLLAMDCEHARVRT